MVKNRINRNPESESPLEIKLAQSFDDFDLPYRQQYPIGVFFADFCFPDKMLVIEVDGTRYHDTIRDAYRDRRMKEIGWTIECYPGWFVHRHSDVIAAKIAYQYFEVDSEQVRGALATYELQMGRSKIAVGIAELAKPNA